MIKLQVIYKINGETFHTHEKSFDVFKLKDRQDKFRNWLNKGKNDLCKKFEPFINKL